MIDSGNLVGDVVSEESPGRRTWPAKRVGRRSSKETATAAGKMRIIGRCYPVKLWIAGIGTSFDIQPWIVRGMKNAVNLGQLFPSRNNAQLTFTEGKVSLRVGGGEVYLEEKGYSGIDGRADEAPAATGSWDRAPPEEREGAWTALLLPSRERERLLGRQPRVRSRGSPSHIRRSLSNSDCVICPLEEASRHQRPGDGTGEPPGRENGGSSTDRDNHWRRGALD